MHAGGARSKALHTVWQTPVSPDAIPVVACRRLPQGGPKSARNDWLARLACRHPCPLPCAPWPPADYAQTLRLWPFRACPTACCAATRWQARVGSGFSGPAHFVAPGGVEFLRRALVAVGLRLVRGINWCLARPDQVGAAHALRAALASLLGRGSARSLVQTALLVTLDDFHTFALVGHLAQRVLARVVTAVAEAIGDGRTPVPGRHGSRCP